MHTAPIYVACLACLAAGCRSGPLGTLPEPYRESPGWSLPEAASETFLGLETRENLSGSLEALAYEPGVQVTTVAAGSPAAEADVRRGDVVLALDGAEIDRPATLADYVARHAAGDQVMLRVRRGDTVFDVPTLLRASGSPTGPAPEELWLVDRLRSRAAWRTRVDGVELLHAATGTPFERAGVPVGSRVRSVAGEPVATARRLLSLLRAHDAGQRVEVEYVAPDGGTQRAKVRLFDVPRRITEAGLPILFHYEAELGSAEEQAQETRFVLLDLWLISLFRYERDGVERRWRFLRFFRFASGEGELAE